MLQFLLILLVLWILGYLVYRYGVKVILTEKSGNIVAIRKFAPTPVLIGIGVVLLLVLYFVLSFRNVPVGHALVKFNVITKRFSVATEGLRIVPLFLYRTHMYDLRRQEYTMTSRKGEGKRKDTDDSLWSPTKEGLQVGLDLTVWFRIKPDKVIDVHRFIGPDFNEKVIRPAIRSIVRHRVSGHSVIEVYSSQRKEIQDEIENSIRTELAKDGFNIERVILRDVHFTPEFARAIEEKQIAEQEAEKMEYVLKKEEKEAERKKIEAGGKARAIDIISKELRRNPQYIQYLYVDKLSDKVKVVVSDQGTIMDIRGALEEK